MQLVVVREVGWGRGRVRFVRGVGGGWGGRGEERGSGRREERRRKRKGREGRWR